MNSVLYNIKDFIDETINSFSCVIGLDLYVIDNNLLRISGTGKTKALIGLSLPKGCANDLVITSGNLIVLDNPTENDICKSHLIKTGQA